MISHYKKYYVIDADILPFHQHGHLQQYGEFLHSVDLFGSSSIADVRERLLSYLASHEGVGGRDDWIRGIGWDQMALGGMPTAVRFHLFLSLVPSYDGKVNQSSQFVDRIPQADGQFPGFVLSLATTGRPRQR